MRVTEAGRHCTRLDIRAWDLDQIAWVVARDAAGGRRIRPGTEPDQRHFAEYRCLPSGSYAAEDCNLITDAGWTYIMNGFAGSSVTKFTSATSGRIGAGTSGTAAAYGDTDLGAATGSANRQWEVVNAVPAVGSTHSGGLVLAAQFPTTDGNFAWAEFGTDLGTSAGTGAAVAPLVTHGNVSPGTKTSAVTWVATITITWT